MDYPPPSPAPIPPFCPPDPSDGAVPPPWDDVLLPPASSFLASLDLPPVHPLCLGPANATDGLPPPPTTSDASASSAVSFSGAVTLYMQVAPALLAMSELWLRLFAVAVAPLAALHLFHDEVGHIVSSPTSSAGKGLRSGAGGGGGDAWHRRLVSASSVMGLASASVLLTDTMYVHEFGGRRPGAALFLLLWALSARAWLRHRLGWATLSALFVIKLLTAACLLRSGGGDTVYDSPGLDLPRVEEGLYYSPQNEVMVAIADSWPVESRTYSYENGATPWLPTGDARTGIPFLVNSAPPLPSPSGFHRVWVPNPEDGEAVALDVAFPPDGSHSRTKPLYLVLHGLNGGSDEEYVREFAVRRAGEGSTVAVMVARGLMDTPVAGWNVFHGARTSDVHSAALALRRGLGPDQILAGVGYSMGAIVLSNYVARYGDGCALDAAMAVSGGLDMREQLNVRRSMRLWQPMVAQTLRDVFIVGKFDARYRARLTAEQYLSLMRASHISSIDEHAVVSYNSFDDLEHYYTEMSAMGDNAAFRATGGAKSKDASARPEDDADADAAAVGRIANVSVPFCVLHALDDPLVTWRTVGGDPDGLVRSGGGNVMLLLTKSGGHVGWPLGMNPRAEGWRWMNDAVRGFVDSVDGVLRARRGSGRGRAG